MWKEAFEESIPAEESREYGEQYLFGPPATEEELLQAEEALGVAIPDELKDLLREFNGIWVSTIFDRESGRPPKPVFLDVAAITKVPDSPDIRDMMDDRQEQFEDELDEDSDDEAAFEDGASSAGDDFKKIVFFWQQNGGADRYGICATDVAEFTQGAIVRIDHESSGYILEGFPDLISFVRSERSK